MARLISVVLPTFDHAQFLPRAIESVREQTYPQWELIIVNDGSTDQTAELLSRVSDPEITVVTLSRNSRLPRALNVAFALARGDYLTWTSADNEMLPDCLATLAQFLDDHPEVGLVYGSHRNLGTQTTTTVKVPFSHTLLLQGVNVVGPCFLYRREVMETVGPYDPDCFGAEDYDMWLRVAERFPMAALPDVLYVYRHHDQSITARHPDAIRVARDRAQQKRAIQ